MGPYDKIYRTGETAPVSGIYNVVNHKHPKQITMIKDKEFPPCAECREVIWYKLAQQTQH